MVRSIILSAFVVFATAGLFAETPQVTPPPQPAPTVQPTPAGTPVSMQPSTRSARAVDPFASPASLDRGVFPDPMLRATELQRHVVPIYRKPTSKELDSVAVEPSILAKYSEVLRQNDTGAFILLPDAGCAVDEHVVSAKDECIRYSMPGAGNSFSFRTGNYRIKHLADISLANGQLRITGIFMNGIMAELGDVPLDGVSMNSPGVVPLRDFEPVDNFEDAKAADQIFAKGMKVGEYFYAKRLPAERDKTYVIRTVAYRGRVVKAAGGMSYNELDYDKRKDLTIVFRVVDMKEDGSLTIIWKQLAEADSPKLRPPKVDPDDRRADNEGNK